jgi:hypothetical protein
MPLFGASKALVNTTPALDVLLSVLITTDAAAPCAARANAMPMALVRMYLPNDLLFLMLSPERTSLGSTAGDF